MPSTCAPAPDHSPLRPGLLALGLALLTTFAIPSASAQASFNGIAFPVITQAHGATGVAVDQAGDFFIATSGSRVILKETPVGDGTYTETVIDSNVLLPFDIVVDPSGNVFFTDTTANRVVRLTPGSGGNYTESTVDNLTGAAGLAIDSFGNLYVTTADSAFMETLGASSYSRTTVATGLHNPSGITVDTHGNIYISNTDQGEVLVEIPGDGSYSEAVLFTGLTQPMGLAIDANKNLFIAGSGSILKETLSAGSYSATVVANGLGYPQGVTFDANGDLFVADPSLARILKLALSSVNFGPTQVGTPGNTVYVPFTFAAGTTVGSISVLTSGASGKDFADAGGSTCLAQTYSNTTQCLVDIALNPTHPGLRGGAIVVADSNGNPLSTVPLYGTGIGPFAIFLPSTVSPVSNSTIRSAAGIAVDGAGYAYIADLGARSVYKVAPDGSKTLFGKSWSSPRGVAVDGAGNVYVADSKVGIVKQTPAGVQTILQTSGILTPYGVAVDGANNIYVTDPASGGVYKINSLGFQTKVTTMSQPVGVAVDQAGTIYITDTRDNLVQSITSTGVRTVLAFSLANPTSVAVDAAGDVYVALNGGGAIQEILAGGLYPPYTIATTATPYGIAIDGDGNLYYSDSSHSIVRRLNRSIAATQRFGTTWGGLNSPEGPKTTILQNIGNSTLLIKYVFYPIDFPESDSGTSDCVSHSTVISGAGCFFTFDFSPTTVQLGNTSLFLSEGAKLYSNNLNTYVQNVSVSGTEKKRSSVLRLTSSNMTPTIGSQFTLTATVTDPGMIPSNSAPQPPSGSVIFFSGTTLLATVPLSSGIATFQPQLNTGYQVITATYVGSPTYAGAKSGLNLQVLKVKTAFSMQYTTVTTASGIMHVSFTAAAALTYSNVFPTGTVTFYTDKSLSLTTNLDTSGQATFDINAFPFGNHSVTAVYAGDSFYSTGFARVFLQNTIEQK